MEHESVWQNIQNVYCTLKPPWPRPVSLCGRLPMLKKGNKIFINKISILVSIINRSTNNPLSLSLPGYPLDHSSYGERDFLPNPNLLYMYIDCIRRFHGMIKLQFYSYSIHSWGIKGQISCFLFLAPKPIGTWVYCTQNEGNKESEKPHGVWVSESLCERGRPDPNPSSWR